MTLGVYEKEVRAHGKIGGNDRIWFPRWLRRYAISFPRGLSDDLPITRNGVVRFSQGLRDRGAPAWQRWQAVRAIAFYRNVVLDRTEPDLSDIVSTLAGAGRKERNIGLEEPPTREELEQLRGNINSNEPAFIQAMRSELRVLHYSMATERAYVPWVKRFSGYVGSTDLDQFNELEIGAYLTSLAVDGHVSASTQNQAQSSLIFFYHCVLGKQLGFIDASRAKKPESIPVWFSREEIARMLEYISGVPRLMFLLMYGAGLRHNECRRLRIKDVCFDQKHIVVRNGKGDKDRITFLPEQAVEGLKAQIEEAKRLHRIDVEEGFEQVYMPNALAKKYPTACREAAWKWIFPAHRRCLDKRTGQTWRHHVSEEHFRGAFKRAMRHAGTVSYTHLTLPTTPYV